MRQSLPAVRFAIVLAVALAAPVQALVPPWYYFHAKLRATLEGGPLKVLELEQANGHWVVPVQLSGPAAGDVGDALATVLRRTYLGGTVMVEVRLPGGRVLPARAPGSAVRRRGSDGAAIAIRTLQATSGAAAPRPGNRLGAGSTTCRKVIQMDEFGKDDV